MTERGSVRFGDTTIEYQVRRSHRRRKTVQVTIDGSGVQVLAPADMPVDDVQALVRKRAPWIVNHSYEETVAATPKRFVSGETLPYLGRNVCMVFKPGDVSLPEIRFDHWRFNVTMPKDLPDSERYERVQRTFVEWYRAKASPKLEASVKKWFPRFGGGPVPALLVRSQRQRWGSCAPDGSLRFNWRVMMLKPALLDYVVVHELAHLTVRSHSADYWALVNRVMPDAQERRRKLREVGKILPL